MVANYEPNDLLGPTRCLYFRSHRDDSILMALASDPVCDFRDYDHLPGLFYAHADQILEPNRGL